MLFQPEKKGGWEKDENEKPMITKFVGKQRICSEVLD